MWGHALFHRVVGVVHAPDTSQTGAGLRMMRMTMMMITLVMVVMRMTMLTMMLMTLEILVMMRTLWW